VKSERISTFGIDDGECGGSSVLGCKQTAHIECIPEDVCGDGIVQLGEDCDYGNLRSSTCDEKCKYRRPENDGSMCGNGVLESGEQCDDGNLDFGDGCHNCSIVLPCFVSHSIETGCSGSSLAEVLDIPLDGTSFCMVYNTMFCGKNSVSVYYDTYFGKIRYDMYGGFRCSDVYFGSLFGDGCLELIPMNCVINPSMLVECSPHVICGDGMITGDEECDPGDVFGSEDCTSHCKRNKKHKVTIKLLG
jgi:cysteine-rich repeat protein